MNDLDVIEVVACSVIGAAAICILWAFSHVPGAFLAEEKCLSKGFPKSAYTWNYKTYCASLDGAVTVRVEEIK